MMRSVIPSNLDIRCRHEAIPLPGIRQGIVARGSSAVSVMRPVLHFGQRVTFQAMLFESTGVIEMHYCNLIPGATGLQRELGATATVGIEDSRGVRSFVYSQRPLSVTTAIRFAPPP